jgi:hypothetical protein
MKRVNYFLLGSLFLSITPIFLIVVVHKGNFLSWLGMIIVFSIPILILQLVLGIIVWRMKFGTYRTIIIILILLFILIQWLGFFIYDYEIT